MRRAAAVVVALVVVVAAAAAAVTALTNTNFGREYVRRLAVTVLNKAAHGHITIGHLDGNLLREIIVTNATITDSAGAPFIAVRRAAVRYSLRDLLHKRLTFRSAHVDHPVVVLTESPPGIWNFDRIFPSSHTPQASKKPSFGDWIAATDVHVVDGRFILHLPERTLQADSITAWVPTLRIADPATPVRSAQVATLRTNLYLINPIPARVTNLTGTVYIARDSLWTANTRITLPNSNVTGVTGRMIFTGPTPILDVVADADPVALDDIRFAYPRLPSEGLVRARARATWRSKSQDYRAEDLHLATGPTRATGTVELHLDGDSLEPSVKDTHLQFAAVDTRLLEQVVPNLHLPRQGELSGTADVDGSLRNARIKAAVAFADTRTQTTSHVTVTGGAGMSPTHVIHADSMVVTLDSLRIALARTLFPTLPVGGVVSGQIRINGATNTELSGDADLTHTARTGTSHLELTGSAQFAGRPSRHPLVNVDATVAPLSLVTAGRFAPALGLQGVATGTASLTGDLGDLTLQGRLRLTADTEGANTDGADSIGVLALQGHLDLATPAPNYGYAVTAQAKLLDVHAVVTHAPTTTLTASLSVSGRGIEPATMHASVDAAIQTSIIDSVSVESAMIKGSTDSGLVHLDTASVSIKNARVDLAGTFGLVATRSGTLTYRVAIDSLDALRRFLPPSDTARAKPNERAYIAAVQRIRGDTAPSGPPPPTLREQVERAVSGAPLPELVPTRMAPVDTVPIRHTSVYGHIVAAGVVRGSLDRFDVRGRAAATDVVAHGGTLRRMRVEYAWLRAPSRAAPIIVGAQLDTVAYGRWALDSVDARVTYHQPDGTIIFLLRQRAIPSTPGGPPTHDQEYTANASLRLEPRQETVVLNSLALRFDTTFWSAPQAATIRFDSTGLAIHGLALHNGGQGHVIADGTIPNTGQAQFHVDISQFQAGDLAALIESHLIMQGLVMVNADIAGTTEAPTAKGEMSVTNVAYDGRRVPDVSTDFTYDANLLDAHARVWRRLDPYATNYVKAFAYVDARIPIKLGKVDSTESRLPEDGPVDIRLVADSTPLELIPEFVSSVQNVTGRATANIHWTGSLKHPDISGRIAYDSGSVFVVPLGIALTNITLRLRGTHDSITIDSLIARSQGTIRIHGDVDITDPHVPVVSLVEQAHHARVINTKERGWLFIDDSLVVEGPVVSPYAYGHVRVTDGVLYVPNAGESTPLDVTDPTVYAIADTSIASVRNAIPSPNTILRNLLLDIDVGIAPQVWVRNKDANVEVYTDDDVLVRSDRRHHAMVLDGVINSDRGQYTFLTKRFEVAKGQATFIGTRDFDPTVQATALYGVQPPTGQPFNIKILISGTATQPKIALTSDVQPPLSQSDLINYLAFGSTSTSLLSQATVAGGTSVAPPTNALQSTDQSQALQEKLATLAIGTATQQFQGDLARTLDADVFNITTGDTPVNTFNNATVNQFLYGTQFEFGKYFTPQMYVAFQARASNWGQAPPGAVIQTRVAPGLTLEAAYQPIFLLQVPSLTTNQINPTKVFGLFVVKDWRF